MVYWAFYDTVSAYLTSTNTLQATHHPSAVLNVFPKEAWGLRPRAFVNVVSLSACVVLSPHYFCHHVDAQEADGVSVQN